MRFAYDALGRRVRKTSQSLSGQASGHTEFVWEGMRLLQEQHYGSDSATPKRITTHMYEPDSYVPLARIDTAGNTVNPQDIQQTTRAANQAQFYWYHTNASGAPEEFTDQEHWRARCKTGGNLALKDEPEARFQQGLTPQMQDQPLKMQGQYADAETGLTTTRFAITILMSAGSCPKIRLGWGEIKPVLVCAESVCLD